MVPSFTSHPKAEMTRLPAAIRLLWEVVISPIHSSGKQNSTEREAASIPSTGQAHHIVLDHCMYDLRAFKLAPKGDVRKALALRVGLIHCAEHPSLRAP
jgi:hypothetical protein